MDNVTHYSIRYSVAFQYMRYSYCRAVTLKYMLILNLGVMEEQRQKYPCKVSQLNGKTIEFYHGDCKVGMQKYLKDNSVDVVVTSPPYNIGLNYNNNYKDNLSQDKYLRWIEDVGIEIKRVLKDDGSFFLNIGNIPSDQWITDTVAGRMKSHFVR